MILCLISMLLTAGPGAVQLPGIGELSIDYVAFDAATNRLWVPSGGSGRIDVIDATTSQVTSIPDQPTKARGARVSGPSSASVGQGVVFVGNRASSTVCRFDSKSLAAKGCVSLASSPDGVLWVPTTREVWVTLPELNSLAVVSTTGPALTVAATIKLEGSPEGYALDTKRGLFYTNLEDSNQTVAIDVKTRKVKTSWKLDCGERGPRGVALDAERNQLFVACTNGLRVLDGSGRLLSSLETGEGVDNIDYVQGTHTVLVASGSTALLSAIEISPKGQAALKTTYPTAPGCRTVLNSSGKLAWLPDSRGHRVVWLELSKEP